MASNAPPTPTVTGVSENAAVRLKRSSRIGFGGGTAPFGMATTTVMAALGGMSSWVNVAVVPALVAPAHGSVDIRGPLKHAIRVMSAGAVTRAVARSMRSEEHTSELQSRVDLV